MDYKKRYKEALEKAKKLYGKYCINNVLEDLFPELKESEDDRIVRCLLNYFNHVRYNGLDLKDTDVDEVIAWLKKQGKEEYVLKSFRDEDVHEFMQYIEKQAKAYEFNLPNRGYDIYAFAKDILHWLEKQSEQKPAENVEIKFCEGDKIVSIQDRKVYTVGTAYWVNGDNICLHGTDGNHKWTNEDDLNKNYRLWTLKDAKDGDVLVDEDNNIGIYIEEKDDLYWYSRIYLGCDNRLRGFSIGAYHKHNNTKPATKEQRDLLFQKIKEAGYEWDSEKKELKKIESKTIDADKVIEWLKNTIKETKEYFGEGDMFYNIHLTLPYNSIEDLINNFKENFKL